MPTVSQNLSHPGGLSEGSSSVRGLGTEVLLDTQQLPHGHQDPGTSQSAENSHVTKRRGHADSKQQDKASVWIHRLLCAPHLVVLGEALRARGGARLDLARAEAHLEPPTATPHTHTDTHAHAHRGSACSAS
jgi:hypothetical protein